MEKILHYYYDNEAKNLKGVVDKLLRQFGGIDQKDYDDFYSIANEVFAKIIKEYDPNMNFKPYLYSCIDRKLKSEITSRNRIKRQSDRNAVYLDKPTDDGEATFGDFVESNFDLEKEVFDEEEVENPKLKMYLDKLSKVQRRIIEMISIDYLPEEIEEELHITHEQYLDGIQAIHSYKNISVLL